ncbi:MAG: hypothetical protein NVSMB19_03790 [Vulcanimicrobiaceae bacterium]
MGSRKGLSSVLILGALVLVVAIFVGNNMGNRVLGQISRRAGGEATPIPIPSASAADTATNRALWKRRQVLSVATDPAFPDPRITPEPVIPATPRPFYARPKSAAVKAPKAARSPVALPPEATPDTTYTSPPLPLPIVTHSAEETIAPDEVQTVSPRSAPASGRPQPAVPRSAPTVRPATTLPPVSAPSPNP